MAKVQNYRISWDDGEVRYLQLSEKDHDRWKERAADKTNSIKSIERGDPEPANAAPSGGRRASA